MIKNKAKNIKLKNALKLICQKYRTEILDQNLFKYVIHNAS